MVDVFISYKREERSRCARIADKLRAYGLDVWFDAKLESGTSFDAEIEGNINTAKAVLVLWSPDSAKSTWIRNEATIGQQRDVLVSVEIAPCKRPINFTNTHTEQLHDAEFGENDPGWVAVLRRIGTLADKPHLMAYASALAGTRRERPRRSAGPAIAAVSVVMLAAGAAAGAFLGPSLLPQADASSAVAEPKPPDALDLVGVWGGADFPCESLPLRVSIEPEGLGLVVGRNAAKSQETLVSPADPAGWFESKSGGASNFWRRDAETLIWRIGSSEDASQERRLGKCDT